MKCISGSNSSRRPRLRTICVTTFSNYLPPLLLPTRCCAVLDVFFYIFAILSALASFIVSYLGLELDRGLLGIGIYLSFRFLFAVFIFPSSFWFLCPYITFVLACVIYVYLFVRSSFCSSTFLTFPVSILFVTITNLSRLTVVVSPFIRTDDIFYSTVLRILLVCTSSSLRLLSIFLLSLRSAPSSCSHLYSTLS
ncbi:hypothetical protein F5878DRAFT_381236 [Lentinula raphanica]|uniref:Uncharacterized protein n=1 Tax=Lentinula raphanica TaxID=153919 RepID=A0AA38U7V5_9AGAR|nr:hypothetical protein F5878DRAFT_381236 [Lentinula raphanica]